MGVDSVSVETLMERLGHAFARPELLTQALTHKSHRNELPVGMPGAVDNERLEFLGDAVLDLALSDLLMSRFASDQEGSLSKKRASLVNEEQLAQLARDIGLVEHIRLGKGERQTGGLNKPRILASTFEAVLGAVFLDAGYPAAMAVVHRLFEPRMAAFSSGAVDFASDYKTRLQEAAQEKFKIMPTYHLERETGPDHEKVFEVTVRLEGRVIGTGGGRNKKAAEQEAAKRALAELDSASAAPSSANAGSQVESGSKRETKEEVPL